MFRTLNATVFNTIANDPGIRPYLGGTETLDLTTTVENPANFCFLNDNKTGGHISSLSRQWSLRSSYIELARSSRQEYA
jgi:hypothetical protein